jgi:hypothetical protein
LTIASAALDDAGVYSVDVSNSGGQLSSSQATLNVLPALGGVVLFSDDFESLESHLGPSVDEGVGQGVAGTAVWTSDRPAGWTRLDDIPGLNDPEIGVREWEGWNFASREWWATTAGDQRRSEFTKGTGVVAIADPDEWDDKGSPSGLGTFNSHLSTPSVSLDGVVADTVTLRFNSAFRPEGNQKAAVTVSYDGGAPTEVLSYVATTDDKTNETLDIPLHNPAGAKALVVTFSMTDAVNNWYWAIDNVIITGEVPGGSSLSIATTGGQITITWDGAGTLQSADAITGPWNDVVGGASPFAVTPSGNAKFYRLKQ